MLHASLLVAAPHLTTSWRRRYVQSLLNWYSEQRRDLPWRRTADPYAIWISETMLQQTQVATVIEYFNRFMQRFPDVQSLADADEQSVLSMWAGLGYYRRARQLHAAARKIVEEHQGVFPSDISQLMHLPGIGRYTAGAVASIAFDEPAPIVEANTERLYARLLRLQSPPRLPQANALLWQFAQWQLPSEKRQSKTSSLPGGARVPAGAGTINQAAMELGSLICKPVNPHCLICPLAALCPTARDGLQKMIPPPKPKKEFTALHHVALIIKEAGRWLLRLNPTGSWWTGLWDFPRVDITELALGSTQSTSSAKRRLALDATACAQIAEAAADQFGIAVRLSQPLFTLSHGVTRFRITLDCVQAEASGIPASWKWMNSAHSTEYPLTAPARKILQRLGSDR